MEFESYLQKCQTHDLTYSVCNSSECEHKLICKLCIWNKKSDVKHAFEHFDSISDIKLHTNDKCSETDDLFALFHAHERESQNELSIKIENFFSEVNSRKNSLKNVLLKNLEINCSSVIEEFNDIIKQIETYITDPKELSDKTQDPIEELSNIKTLLDDKLAFFSSKKLIDEYLNRRIASMEGELRSLSAHELIFKDLSQMKGKVGGYNLKWDNGKSLALSIDGNDKFRAKTSSYRTFTSQELLTGSFLCKVKVIHVDPLQVRNSFNYTFGIIHNESRAKSKQFYQDSILLLVDGKLQNPYQGGYRENSAITSHWQKGDILIMKRDKKNDIYFGKNDEKTLQLCHLNVKGEFRIVVSMSKSNTTLDAFEMIELREI
jgi:hypothetical protein